MLIEVRKAGFVNKGAELMLLSVLDMVRRELPEAGLVMAPDLATAPYLKRARLGLYQKVWFQRWRVQWGFLGGLLPRPLREFFGLVLDREVDAVLDASGFSYSDQVGLSSVLAAAKACRRWRRRGTRIVLLPQAFGPFEDRRVRSSMREILESADLVFARDDVSYGYLAEISGERENLRAAPDFTCLLDGRVPDWFDTAEHRFCIIPNHRMLEKTTEGEAAGYAPFLGRCCRRILERGEKPFFLIHEGKRDLDIAAVVNAGLGKGIPVIVEDDPLAIKGAIGKCLGVIGSRYHGLVSSLSQGVPAIAAGWSHKYDMLFRDYRLDNGLLEVNVPDDMIDGAVDRLLDPGVRDETRSVLIEAAAGQKEEASRMWDGVFELLRE